MRAAGVEASGIHLGGAAGGGRAGAAGGGMTRGGGGGGGTFEVASTSGQGGEEGMLLCSLRSASRSRAGRRRLRLTASFSEATLQRGEGGQVPWQIGIPVVLGKKGIKGLILRFPENARRFVAGAFAGARIEVPSGAQKL